MQDAWQVVSHIPTQAKPFRKVNTDGEVSYYSLTVIFHNIGKSVSTDNSIIDDYFCKRLLEDKRILISRKLEIKIKFFLTLENMFCDLTSGRHRKFSYCYYSIIITYLLIWFCILCDKMTTYIRRYAQQLFLLRDS